MIEIKTKTKAKIKAKEREKKRQEKKRVRGIGMSKDAFLRVGQCVFSTLGGIGTTLTARGHGVKIDRIDRDNRR